MNKDFQLLEEAYQTILEKSSKDCKWAKKGCDCDDCKDCKANQKKSKELSPKQKKIAQAAPPPDKITGADFAALKKKKKVKEGFAFDDLFFSIISESKKQEVVCNVKINPEAQYECTMKDKKVKTLKGTSVLGEKDNIKSIKPAHQK